MKKADDLSIDKTFQFATQCYADKKTNTGYELMEHCKCVARQAEVIAQRLYNELRPDYVSEHMKETVAAIVHCGLLHDVLNVSACAFENIAEITNVQIAAMVAAISRDYRLVETKRDMEFRGRLSQSAVGTQIVAVADVICTAKEIAKTVDTTGLATAARSKKIMAQLDGDLLAIHAASKYYALRMYVHAAKNLLNDISQKIKAQKQKAKMEKALLQTAKNIKEAAAAKSKETKSKKDKKAEVRYARKRNIRSDSE